jgi:enamine deaminase RidA (YjgF/YER057c/UK114 family)
VERQNVLLGNPYEETVGFSRAVRVGPFVSVGGTAPISADGETVGIGDIEAQTRRCFEIVAEALAGAGASLNDVVRTRMILTRIEDFETVARVRKEYVGVAKPVDTIMAITRFVNREWLIEVEADAVLTDQEAWRP